MFNYSINLRVSFVRFFCYTLYITYYIRQGRYVVSLITRNQWVIQKTKYFILFYIHNGLLLKVWFYEIVYITTDIIHLILHIL